MANATKLKSGTGHGPEQVGRTARLGGEARREVSKLRMPLECPVCRGLGVIVRSAGLDGGNDPSAQEHVPLSTARGARYCGSRPQLRQSSDKVHPLQHLGPHGAFAPGGLAGIRTRQLVAVLYADMVGYSRLIGLDDAGTLARLRSFRTKLIDPALEEHRGQLVQTGGDSLLIVFDSINGAVRCAVEIQRQVPILDGGQPPDHAIRFRMGIDIGDAIADGTDLHGDGVIVAAKLQAECPPGGVCVSRAVRDHVHDRLDLAFEPLGLLSLKNIARPVEAFLAKRADTLQSVEQMPVQATGEPLPPSGRPSIAVLPFTNMSGDTEQEYFSDCIADDIITELSRNRSLFVIARNSSFMYKGRAVDVKQIARELVVRYVLEGGLRRSGDRVRITAQLIDAENNGHIWAERYDSALEDVFAVQDEITAAIVAAVQPVVADAELRRALRCTNPAYGTTIRPRKPRMTKRESFSKAVG